MRIGPVLLSALLAVYAFAAPPGSPGGEFSEADAQLVLDCINNIKVPGGELSPAKADECIDQFNDKDGALMEKAERDFPELATIAVARNNALSDLRDIITKHKGIEMANGLNRVLAKRNVLRQMKLGPQPESLNEWVRSFVQDREAQFSHGIRRWDILGDIRIKNLKTQTEESWARLPLPERYNILYGLACEKTDELLSTAGMAAKRKGALKEYAGLVQVLKDDLAPMGGYDRIDKLDELMGDIGAAAAEPPPGTSAADKKSKDLAAASDKLKGAKAGEGEASFLARTFDNAKGGAGDVSGAGIGGGGGKFTPVPITDAQALQLGPKMAEVKGGKMTGALANEMRGTKSGDEIISFLEDPKRAKEGSNVLNLKFEKGKGDMESAMGWYNSKDKITRINTSVVDKFCADRKITPEQLLKDEAKLRDLAAYVAPTFVHETTHQRQDAWGTERGLKFLQYKDPKTGRMVKDSPYEMEMEAEAFSMNGSFVAERAQKGGSAYLRKLNWSDRADAEKYLEDGVDGLRTQNHGSGYEKIDSIKGAAASQLEFANGLALRVGYLSGKSKDSPVDMTDEERQELIEARAALNGRFKWYKETLAKSKVDERKLMGWRDEIDPDGNVRKVVKVSVLEDLDIGGGE